jgi:DDB1- and CUL4-associated factor 11
VIHKIWSLDGSVVQVLDRSRTLDIMHDPSAPDHPSTENDTYGNGVSCVRDVSWHSREPVLMSCAWEGSSSRYSTVARHEWKGWSKNAMSLQDIVAREREEAAANARVLSAMDDDYY